MFRSANDEAQYLKQEARHYLRKGLSKSLFISAHCSSYSTSLVAITENPKVIMNYIHFHEQIRLKYHIDLVGWPLPDFKNPSNLSSALGPLRTLRDAIKNKTCYFVKLTQAEVTALDVQFKADVKAGKVDPLIRKRRCDFGTKRMTAPVPTTQSNMLTTQLAATPKPVRRAKSTKSKEIISSEDEDEEDLITPTQPLQKAPSSKVTQHEESRAGEDSASDNGYSIEVPTEAPTQPVRPRPRLRGLPSANAKESAAVPDSVCPVTPSGCPSTDPDPVASDPSLESTPATAEKSAAVPESISPVTPSGCPSADPDPVVSDPSLESAPGTQPTAPRRRRRPSATPPAKTPPPRSRRAPLREGFVNSLEYTDLDCGRRAKKPRIEE
jgi:hypothetical protein